MKIKLNTDLKDHFCGDTIEIADAGGIPTDIYWRKRLKDSKHDNCISVVGSKINKKEKKEVT